MDELHNFLVFYAKKPLRILERAITQLKYTPIDLSNSNRNIQGIDITNPGECEKYISMVLAKNDAHVAFGGYLEKRLLYTDKAGFNKTEEPRNIHLGLDFWSKERTAVLAPLDGRVHSFKNNNTHGDYGPTIVLEHTIDNLNFFTLYGHLSLDSLDEIYEGKKIEKGEVMGRLGSPEVNVGYAPHLHFQIIRDLENNYGDYPGVCSEGKLDFYRKNCPDPNLLLKIGQ